MDKYTRTRIKELRKFTVSNNAYTGECSIKLYNEDEAGNEIDTVMINLSRDKTASLIACLQAIQKPKAFARRGGQNVSR